MKIKPADSWFSKCVRHSAGACAKCGKADGQLHHHHIVPRDVRRIRWDKLNAVCLCYVCHKWIHNYPYESGPWVEKWMGKGAFELLMEKRNTYIKITKAEEKEIAKHYNDEYNRMVKENTFEFDSWQ